MTFSLSQKVVIFHQFLSRHRHINWALADQAMVSGVNFLTGILLARFLGLEEFGRFTLAWMAVLFFNSFQQAGIIAPMMSIGPKQEKELQASYYGAVFFHQTIWALACFGLLFLGVWGSGYAMPHWQIRSLALPLATALLAWQLQDFLRRYFFVRGHSDLAFLNDAVSYLGQLLVLVVVFQKGSVESAGVLWIIAITSAVAVILGISQFGCFRFALKDLQRVTHNHWRFSKWLLASAFMQWTSGNFFVVSLGGIVGTGAVGALRAAQNIMGVSHILFQGLENVVPAEAARSMQQGGGQTLRRYLWKITLFCSGLTGAFCLFVSLWPEGVLKIIYGTEYLGYGYLLWWYAPIYLLISLGLALRAGLRALDTTRPIFIAYVAMTLFSLFAAKPLITSFGLTGALIGMLVTQMIFQIYLLLSLAKTIRVEAE